MRTIVTTAVLLIVVAACAKDEPLPQHQASATTPASSQPALTPATTSPTPVSTAGAPVPAASSGSVIATADGETSDVKLNVTELKRGSGGTVTLKFTIMNGSSERMNFSYDFGDGTQGATDYNSVGGVHLIDPVGKRKYSTVRDADNKCVCSRDLKAIEPGKSMNLWVKFPAPPPDVQRVTVVVPHFTPMDDVPVS